MEVAFIQTASANLQFIKPHSCDLMFAKYSFQKLKIFEFSTCGKLQVLAHVSIYYIDFLSFHFIVGLFS